MKLLSLLLALLLSSMALADTQKGISAYKKRNYSAALTEFRESANLGEPTAIYFLGIMYANGRGVEKDLRKGARMVATSAKRGSPYGQFFMGYYFLKKEGNTTRALYWIGKSAKQSFAPAQSVLGWMYNSGIGVKQNFPEAYKWYDKAAKQGDISAQYNIGQLYRKGQGVEKSAATALMWYKRAAAKGNARAQLRVAYMFDTGEGVPKDRSEAAVWYEKAAKQGNPNAQSNLGHMYLKGEGVEKDEKVALIWIRNAAQQKYAKAQYLLGMIYSSGLGVEKDLITAYAWFDVAIKNGFTHASTKRDDIVNKFNEQDKKQAQDLANEYRRLY